MIRLLLASGRYEPCPPSLRVLKRVSGDRRFIVNSGSPHSSTIRNANRVFEIYYLILKRKFILLRLCRTMRRRLQRGSSPLTSQPIRSTTCEGNPLSCMARARQYLLLAGRNIYIISCKSLSTSQLTTPYWQVTLYSHTYLLL